MGITVKDCLSMPSLHNSKVIAGHKGINDIVASVSVVEFYDMIYLFTPNELLLTAFYAMKDDVDAQCAAIKEYKESGDVGVIIFYSDIVLKEISPKLISVANSLDFPIIIAPENKNEITYSQVISEIMEAILLDKQHSLMSANLLSKERIISAFLKNDLLLASRIASNFNLKISDFNFALIIKLKTDDEKEKIIEKLKKIFATKNKVIIYNNQNYIITIGSDLNKSTAFKILTNDLELYLETLKTKIIYSLFTNLDFYKGLEKIYSLFTENIDQAPKIYPLKNGFLWSELEFISKCSLIVNSSSKEYKKNVSILKPLLHSKEDDLIQTASTYFLDANLEVKKTSEILFLHRNTIQYRLTKVKKLLNIYNFQFPMVYDIYISLAILRLLNKRS